MKTIIFYLVFKLQQKNSPWPKFFLNSTNKQWLFNRLSKKQKQNISPMYPNFCAGGSIMMILNISESFAKPLVMAKLNMAYLSSLKNHQNCSFLVSPTRVLHAPGTSLYHLVSKHFRATWLRPEQSHLLPETYSPNGTDSRLDYNARDERSVLSPNPVIFLRDFMLYLPKNDIFYGKGV